MKRHLHALLLACALAAAHAWGQQPIELRFASPAPPPSPMNTMGFSEWIKNVTEAAGGTISIRLMTGPTLASFDNVYDRVLKGVADIGFGTSNESGGQFRKTQVATLPFETENPMETAVALWRLLQRGLIADEYAEVKPLGLYAFAHNLLHTRSAKLRSLADLKGLKLRAGGKLDGDVIAALGAAPVTMSPADMYQAISSGLIEGAMVGWNGVDVFKLQEVTRNHFAAPLTSATAFILMNRRSYERLPPQAKAAIDKYSGEGFSRKMAAIVELVERNAQDRISKMPGHTVESISPEEKARWTQQLAVISADWIKATPNGNAVLSGFREEIKRFRSGN
jgi:TRAP-type C4-dicarboxylate transport system substrate-binding protein